MRVILMILIIVLTNLSGQTTRVGWFNRYGPKLDSVKCSCCSHNSGKQKLHYYKDYYKPKLKKLIPKITIPKLALPSFSIPISIPKLSSISLEPYNYTEVLDNPTKHFKVTNKNK